MSSFLQALRLAYWMHPIQKVITVGGLLFAFLAALGSLPQFLMGAGQTSMPPYFLAVMLINLPAIALAGIYWRSVSAARSTLLAPRGRFKLLSAAWGVMLLAALVWVVCYAWAFREASAQVRPDLLGYVELLCMALATATTLVLGVFFACRSPMAMLITLGVLVLPFFLQNDPPLSAVARSLASAVDAADPERPLWRTGVFLAMAWGGFSIWYLKSRRIAFPGFLRGSGDSMADAVGVSSVAMTSKPRALEQWLLSGSSLTRLYLQWTLVLLLLLLVQLILSQWVLPQSGNRGDPKSVVGMLQATLSLGLVTSAVFVVPFVARSRTALLIAGADRQALFGRAERLMLRLTGGFIVIVALLQVLLLPLLLNVFQLEVPTLTWSAVLRPLVAASVAVLTFGYLALSLWPQEFTTRLLIGAALVVVWMGLSLTQIAMLWPWLRALPFIAPLVMIALREIAGRSWRRGDWPRAATAR